MKEKQDITRGVRETRCEYRAEQRTRCQGESGTAGGVRTGIASPPAYPAAAVCEMLLEAGAACHLRSDFGQTALHHLLLGRFSDSVESNDTERLLLLLRVLGGIVCGVMHAPSMENDNAYHGIGRRGYSPPLKRRARSSSTMSEGDSPATDTDEATGAPVSQVVDRERCSSDVPSRRQAQKELMNDSWQRAQPSTDWKVRMEELEGLDMRNVKGETPLHLAAMYARTYICELLIRNGASPLLPLEYDHGD